MRSSVRLDDIRRADSGISVLFLGDVVFASSFPLSLFFYQGEQSASCWHVSGYYSKDAYNYDRTNCYILGEWKLHREGKQWMKDSSSWEGEEREYSCNAKEILIHKCEVCDHVKGQEALSSAHRRRGHKNLRRRGHKISNSINPTGLNSCVPKPMDTSVAQFMGSHWAGFCLLV